MPVDQLPSGKARPAKRDAKLVRYDEYINKQIENTRRMVKVVDLTTALLVITIGGLGFLLAAAVAEHWLVPGGFSVAARVLLFVVLMGSIGYYAVRRLWPLCVGSINPAYAAQAIEQDNPSLKNSLLNLLLFRQHRHEITDAVYETLEEQAAQRLTRVPVDAAVDRTQLLRLGYALVAVVAVAALYKILSPKDPLVTAERVLMPWADVVPASRVSIANVEPGTVTLPRGELLQVSADVRGIGDDDPVVVRYTTADGQAVDRPAPMKPSSTGLRYTGQIPPADVGSHGGVAQNLRYRIEAGDARSREYSVTVVAAPTISVERIDYDYPDYTGFANHSVERLGDIRAIEGTKVTIHTRANQPIKEAAVDFEADGRRDVPLRVDGNQAHESFVLALRDDRQTPKFTSYAIRFIGLDGRSNRDPVKFPIDVLPDKLPEVAVLAPVEKVRDVRFDETLAIEVEARDPDFALADVRIQGEVAGQPVLDAPLLEKEHTGRFTGRFLFVPRDHKLQVGDVLRYRALARDNREPANEATSDFQSLRIVSPGEQKPGQQPPDRLAQRDKPKSQENEQQQDGQQQSDEGGESNGGAANSQGSEPQQQGDPASSDEDSGADSGGQQDSGDQKDSGESSGEQNGSQSGEAESGGQGEKSGEQSGESQSGGQPGEQSGDAQQQPGEGGQAGGQQAGDPRRSEGKPDANGESGKKSDSDSDSDSDSKKPNDAQHRPNGDGKSSTSEQSPVSPEGENDGEAFDRIRKFLKQEGKLPDEGEQDEGEQQDSESRQQQGESASAEGKQGESEQSDDGKRDEQPSGDEGANESEGRTDQDPGAETRPGDPKQKADEPADKGQESQSPSGQQTSSKGESGAGEQPEQGQGTPDSQPTTKPADKWEQKPSGDEQSKDQDPPSGGRGKQESDSQGEQGGDATGGGEEGGGQNANRDGTGSAGQNQSADEGAGESSEQGAGRDSSSAGQDAESDERTGQSGSQEKGSGSAQRDGDGEQKGGEPSREDAGSKSESGEPASAGGEQPNDESNQPGQQPNDDGTPKPNSTADGNATSGAGRTPEGAMQPTKSDGTAPDADAANLEYSRKQTDLVLETLAEQMKRNRIDKRLLDDLGWSEADLKRFLDRWQQLKAAAGESGASADDAQRELDDALRSLGLRRGPLQQNKVSNDDVRDLRQGYRGAVPLEYQERLRAYNQGVSRARQEGE